MNLLLPHDFLFASTSCFLLLSLCVLPRRATRTRRASPAASMCPAASRSRAPSSRRGSTASERRMRVREQAAHAPCDALHDALARVSGAASQSCAFHSYAHCDDFSFQKWDEVRSTRQGCHACHVAAVSQDVEGPHESEEAGACSQTPADRYCTGTGTHCASLPSL